MDITVGSACPSVHRCHGCRLDLYTLWRFGHRIFGLRMAGMDVWKALERQDERKRCRALRHMAQNWNKGGFRDDVLRSSLGVNTRDDSLAPSAANHDFSKISIFRTNVSVENLLDKNLSS
jgi:hypothetical protein